MGEKYDTQVLIVGAGPVGLTLALELDRFGVGSLVIDRHARVSDHARARFVNSRSMEIFRGLGLEPAIRAAAIPHERASLVIWAPSLGAQEVRRVEIETLGPASGEPLSPSPGLTTSQDRLDPILLGAALEAAHPAVRVGCALVSLDQQPDLVLARCASAAGQELEIRARFLVGADGARSTVRELLGIRMEGFSDLGHTMNITFRADLGTALRGRPVNLAMIVAPSGRGLLLNIDGDRTWTAQAVFSPAAGQRSEDFTDERCLEIVRTQVGDASLGVELLRRAPWASSARTAKRFSQGRVFLAGDAAHEMTPAGGFGMNTGIADAHNLGWKLAAVVRGCAADALLETYDAERRPVAAWVTRESLRNLASVGRVQTQEGTAAVGAAPDAALGRPEFFRERGMVFGARYRSSAVIPDDGEGPAVANPVTDYVPNADPGARAPHLWIEAADEPRSTLDLWGSLFTVLGCGVDQTWSDDIARLAFSQSVPLRAVRSGDERLLTLYGLEPSGAVLVRPDGHVAWRAAAGARPEDVTAAVRAVLGARAASA